MRIAVDAMGGDHAPDDIVRGALLYREVVGTADLVLVGDEMQLKKLVGSKTAGIDIVHAAGVVGMDEHPVAAPRRSRPRRAREAPRRSGSPRVW